MFKSNILRLFSYSDLMHTTYLWEISWIEVSPNENECSFFNPYVVMFNQLWAFALIHDRSCDDSFLFKFDYANSVDWSVIYIIYHLWSMSILHSNWLQTHFISSFDDHHLLIESYLFQFIHDLCLYLHWICIFNDQGMLKNQIFGIESIHLMFPFIDYT